MERKIIVATLSAAFLVAAILPRIVQKARRIETAGCIGIDRRLFLIGKAALFASFLLMLVQAFIVNLSLFRQRCAFFWSGAALTGIGVLLFALAVTKLGTFSLRVGLANAATDLRTTGIYRFSRNPMLLGLYLMALGSAVYVQHPVNWLLVAIALAVHHRIILAEETFLQARFGDRWSEYRRRVRRYV